MRTLLRLPKENKGETHVRENELASIRNLGRL